MPEALSRLYATMDSTAQQELYDFALFLVSRLKQEPKPQKTIDNAYNDLVQNEQEVVCAAARATIWEQIKNDTW